MIEVIKIHTDGSCHGNPGPGGWAAIILNPLGMNMTLRGRSPETTNNRMELTAATKGLQALDSLPEARGLPIVLHSDSKYVIDAFNQGWIANWQRNGSRNAKRQEVANRELWEEVLPLTEGRKITCQWVRGHSGDHFNELCDRIANEEADLAAQGTGPADSAGASTQTGSTTTAPPEATAPPTDPVSELLVSALDMTRSLNNRMQAQDVFIREVRSVMAEFTSADRPGIRIIGHIQIALNRLDEAQENGRGAQP